MIACPRLSPRFPSKTPANIHCETTSHSHTLGLAPPPPQPTPYTTTNMWEVDPETRSKVGHHSYLHFLNILCRKDLAYALGFARCRELMKSCATQHVEVSVNILEQWLMSGTFFLQLLEIQKGNGNNVCVDCNAPSPQWVHASPSLHHHTRRLHPIHTSTPLQKPANPIHTNRSPLSTAHTLLPPNSIQH